MQRYLRLLLLGVCASGLLSCGNEEQQTTQALQPPTVLETGKAVFQQYCTACHLLQADGTGPTLQGVLGRWGGDSARIRAFIRNPQKLIDEKDPDAMKSYEKWKPAMMTGFPQLSDEDLNAVIAYLESGK
jgi:cytochrome c2